MLVQVAHFKVSLKLIKNIAGDATGSESSFHSMHIVFIVVEVNNYFVMLVKQESCLINQFTCFIWVNSDEIVLAISFKSMFERKSVKVSSVLWWRQLSYKQWGGHCSGWHKEESLSVQWEKALIKHMFCNRSSVVAFENLLCIINYCHLKLI